MKNVIGKKKSEKNFSILMGIIAGIAGLILVGIPTDVIPNSRYTRMIPSGMIEVILLIAFSVLLGVYAGTFIYVYLTNRVDKHKKVMASSVGKGTFGVFGSWFAISCPTCIPLLVSIFGSGALMKYYEPVRPYLGVLSVGLLAFGVYHNNKIIKGECKTCKVKN